MAADYISVNKTKTLGASLVRSADLFRELRELVDKLNDVGQHSFTGSDYTVFEANFGLVAGTGANALTLLGLINTIVNSNTDVTGANRLAQMDEYVARLAGQ